MVPVFHEVGKQSSKRRPWHLVLVQQMLVALLINAILPHVNREVRSYREPGEGTDEIVEQKPSIRK